MKLGNWVKVRTRRPHIEQYSGCTGEITRITSNDIAYVCVGRQTVPFYFDELELISPVEGGAV